jgi:hypothetical protein
LYYLVTSNIKIFILAHVDDYIIASSSRDWTRRFITAFNDKYGVNSLGKLSHFMQMSIEFTKTAITLSQQRFIEELASEYHMDACKPVPTPMVEHFNLQPADTFDDTLPYRSLLGSLLWIARGTRPDISFAIAYLSQFCNCYSEQHFSALKRVLRYLIGTKTKKLHMPVIRSDQLRLEVYSDSDWAADLNDRKSVTGTITFLNHMPISWSSRKQSIVTTSSTEAEYVAATESIKDLLYTRNLVEEFLTISTPVVLNIDNSGAIHLAEKNLNNRRTKHIDIRFHYVRQWVQSKVVTIQKVHTLDNTADLFTKALPVKLHEHHTATLVR